MKQVLLDIISHTLPLGVIDLVKITGSDTKTIMNAVASDRSVIINTTFKKNVEGFIGVFGMPNLPKLKTILSFSDEYNDDSIVKVLTVDRNGEDQPATIHFENNVGNFVNDYRLMGKELVEERVKNVPFKGANWNIEFVPNAIGISRLKKQASVHGEDTVFSTKVIDNNLCGFFGNASSHCGNFVLHSEVNGTLNKTLMWPVKQFLSIIDLPGDKKVYIAEAGAMKVIVTTEVAEYEYLIPAQR